MSKDKTLYKGINPEIRLKRGYTQEELSKMTKGKISVRTIQNYELGLTDASATNLILLSQLLRTTPNELLGIPIEAYDPYNSTDIYPYKFYYNYHSVADYKGKRYNFNNNFTYASTLGYIIAERDYIDLGIPKGAIIIFDTNYDAKKLFEDDRPYFIGIKVVPAREEGEKPYYHISRFHNASNDRRLYNYLHIDQHGKAIQQTSQYINFELLGVVKKVIVDY